MVTRRGFFAAVVGSILGYLGVSHALDRDGTPDLPGGTGPTAGGAEDDHVLHIPPEQTVTPIEGREYVAIEWGNYGVLALDEGDSIMLRDQA